MLNSKVVLKSMVAVSIASVESDSGGNNGSRNKVKKINKKRNTIVGGGSGAQ